MTKIYTALTTTEGRILGALAAKDSRSVVAQQSHLARLMQMTLQAAIDLRSLVKPALHDFQGILNNRDHPITTKQMSEELGKWPSEGIPIKLKESFLKAGLSVELIEVIRQRLAEPALRGKVLDFSGSLESLSTHLMDAATGAQHEAQKFFSMKL